MTISKAQGKALFGKAAAWEMMFVARPADPLEAAAAWLADPKTCAMLARRSGDHGADERPERWILREPGWEERVRAYLYAKLDARETQWGTA
jgi:hypothetical protein